MRRILLYLYCSHALHSDSQHVTLQQDFRVLSDLCSPGLIFTPIFTINNCDRGDSSKTSGAVAPSGFLLYDSHSSPKIGRPFEKRIDICWVILQIWVIFTSQSYFKTLHSWHIFILLSALLALYLSLTGKKCLSSGSADQFKIKRCLQLCILCLLSAVCVYDLLMCNICRLHWCWVPVCKDCCLCVCVIWIALSAFTV